MSAGHNVSRTRVLAEGRLPRRLAQPASTTDVHLCIPDDQLVHLTQGQAIPQWPAGRRLPRNGEVIYLTSTSAWVVVMVIHELLPGSDVRVEVWLEWVGAARQVRYLSVSNFVH